MAKFRISSRTTSDLGLGSFGVLRDGGTLDVEGQLSDFAPAPISALVNSGLIDITTLSTQPAYDNATLALAERSDISQIILYDDFLAGMAGGVQGNGNWSVNGSGSGAASASAPASSPIHDYRAGILLMNVAGLNSFVSLRQGIGFTFTFGNGELEFEGDIYLNTNSATDRFRVRAGYTSSASSSDETVAATRVGFLCDVANSDFWQLEFSHNSVVLGTVTTSLLCSGPGWVRLRLLVSADGRTARFWINNKPVGQISAEYTPLESQRVSASVTSFKTLGAATKSVCVDWIRLRKDLIRDRPFTQVH